MLNNKLNPPRITDTLSAIEEPWFLFSGGQIYVQQIQFRLKSFSFADKLRIDSALSLGARADDIERPKFSTALRRVPAADGMTNKRRAIRACMLAEMTMKNRSPTLLNGLLERLNRLSMAQVLDSFTTLFPLVADFGNLATWTDGFTDPNQHDTARFRYIVHAIRVLQPNNPNANVPIVAGQTILANPRIIQAWAAISCSVIDQTRSETYHDCGLILRVPAQNILVTSHHDIGFRNHAGLGQPMGASPERLLQNQAALAVQIRDQNHQHGVHRPEEILARTGTVGRFNEIVVAGTNPGPPSASVQTIGLFVQQPSYVGQLRPILDNAAAQLNIPLVIL